MRASRAPRPTPSLIATRGNWQLATCNGLLHCQWWLPFVCHSSWQQFATTTATAVNNRDNHYKNRTLLDNNNSNNNSKLLATTRTTTRTRTTCNRFCTRQLVLGHRHRATSNSSSTAALAGNLRSLSSCHQQDRFASTLSLPPIPHPYPLCPCSPHTGSSPNPVQLGPHIPRSINMAINGFVGLYQLRLLHAACCTPCSLLPCCLAAFATFTASGIDIGICS